MAQKRRSLKDDAMSTISTHQSYAGGDESNLIKNLEKYCYKQLFEISFMNPLGNDIMTKQTLDQIIKVNKSYETQSHITFITYEDVISFIHETSVPNLNIEFPPLLLPALNSLSIRLVLYLEGQQPIPDNLMAEIMKYKLIEVMYKQYAGKVRQTRRNKQLHAELDALAGVPATGKLKGKSGQTSKTTVESKSKQTVEKGKPNTKGKKNVEPSMPYAEDFTGAFFEDNDITIADDITKQMLFYVFQGFKNPGLIKELTDIHVPISAVFQICENEHTPESTFWQELNRMLEYTTESEFLQNTAILRYTYHPLSSFEYIANDVMLKRMLEELANVVHSIINLKRQHLNYIRNLKIVNAEDQSFSFVPNNLHNILLNRYPMESVTVPIILNSIIEEVLFAEKKTASSDFMSKPIPLEIEKHFCPFDIKSFFTDKMKKEKKIDDFETPYQFYNSDEINLTISSYKDIGVELGETIFSMYQKLQPYQLLKQYPMLETPDIPHTHDRGVPTDEKQLLNDEQIDNFINLYCASKIVRKKSKVPVPDSDIQTLYYDQNEQQKKCAPKIYYSGKSTDVGFADAKFAHVSNLYEMPNVMSYHWIETLRPVQLSQYLWKANTQFLSMNHMFCPDTNTLIVKYYNNLDEFGCRTEVWNQSLRSTVCLRDFCRYSLAQDSTWLKNNPPLKQIQYEATKMFDETLMIKKMCESPLYKQYSYLINPAEPIEQKKEINPDKYTPNLDIIFNELLIYPKNAQSLLNLCGKHDKPTPLNAYQFGPNLVQLVGSTNYFYSHDNVDIKLDSSRFTSSVFKLSLSISHEETLFQLHTHEKSLKFNVTLSEGTIISIAKPMDQAREIKTTFKEPPLVMDESLFSEVTGDSAISKKQLQSLTKQTGKGSIKTQKTITTMDLDKFLKRSGSICENLSVPKKNVNKSIETETKLLTNLLNNPACYKISNSKKELKYVIRKNAQYNVPISDVVKRVLNNPTIKARKMAKNVRKKCMLLNDIKLKTSKNIYEFQISQPNGLIIKSVVSEINPKDIDIKQYYLDDKKDKCIANESYRLFTNCGTIVVRTHEGIIKIYKANGSLTAFEDPQPVKECPFSRKTSLTKDLNMCRKQLQKLIPTNYSDDKNPGFAYYTSRRTHLTSKQKHFSEQCVNQIFSDNFPYKKVILNKFDGKVLKIKNNKLVEKQHSRMSFKYDYRAGSSEMFFDRSDGFKSLFDKNGKQIVQFVDGTKITSRCHVDEEPVFIDEQKMGWLLIQMIFTYEHPHYATVIYNNSFNCCRTVMLTENKSLNFTMDSYNISVDNFISLNFDTEKISFLKRCHKNCAFYSADVNIKPLYNGEVTNPNDEFLSVKDTYKKNFVAYFSGKCKRNSNFIKGRLNKYECNHYIQRKHKKIFFLKKDLNGLLIWNDKDLYHYAHKYKFDDNAKVISFMDSEREMMYVKLLKAIYEKYNERFVRKLPCLALSRTSTQERKPLVYTTIRCLYNMYSAPTLSALLGDMQKNLPELPFLSGLFKLINHVIMDIENAELLKFLHKAQQKPKEERLRLGVIDKVNNWRLQCIQMKELFRQPVIPYFKSKFYLGDNYEEK